MEKLEEKIIDLVDVIAEPDPSRLRPEAPAIESVDEPPEGPPETPAGTSPDEFEALVRREVEKMLRSMIGDHIQAMIKEILAQEIEKAISREISGLKKS